jgi:hypothetical protein
VPANEIADALVGDEPASADRDQVIRRHRHLAHQVGQEEHRPALGGKALQEIANPADALGVGPRKPVTIPGLTENDRSFTAVVSPYRFVRPLASIMRSPSIPGDQSLGAVHENWMRGAADRVWLDSAACS